MIQLTKELVMTSDGMQYIVGKPGKTRGKGVEIIKPRYYTTAAQAVRGALATAIQQMVAAGDITTMQQFIAKQEQLQAEFSQLLGPLNGCEVEKICKETER